MSEKIYSENELQAAIEYERLKYSDYEFLQDAYNELIIRRRLDILKENGITDDRDISKALEHITGDTYEEIEQSLENALIELRLDQRKRPGDPSLGNGVKKTPSQVNPRNDAMKRYDDLKNKGRVGIYKGDYSGYTPENGKPVKRMK